METVKQNPTLSPSCFQEVELINPKQIRKHSCAYFAGLEYEVPQDELDKEWCYIHGSTNYIINKDGRIWSLKSLKFLSPCQRPDGYKVVTLTLNRKSKPYLLHRLIAEAFVLNPLGCPIVDHINQDKSDNHIENLRWVTKSANQRNANYKRIKYPHLPRGVRYYEKSKSRPYMATISIDGGQLFLGCFKTIEEASQKYESKYSELMNQFNVN